MATRTNERERLQPALLDRLLDDAPEQRQDRVDQRAISKPQLRVAILRDLASLFNAVRPNWIDMDAVPHVASSVLNYGLPPMAGEVVSQLNVSTLEQAIKQAIITFEPRILPDSIVVRAVEADDVLDTHNRISINLSGRIWAQPIPLEFLIRTELDLETGQMIVRDQS
ncbi:type VI secretion system baseplate subunit TssE [soil metagenome]